MKILLSESNYKLLFETSATSSNLAYHAGDLKHKTETLAQIGFHITNTGHMGSGFYFYGDLMQAVQHVQQLRAAKNADEFSEKRPIYAVDFSKYRLYDARNNATEFYKTMKAITMGLSKVNETFFTTDKYEELLQDIHSALEDLNISLPINVLDEILQNFTYDLIDHEDGDMLASRIMKKIGYEGIDVRGSELDNFGVGSILFDIKPNTAKRVV